MPKIFDNDQLLLAEELNVILDSAQSADFCVGYFNLKGWGKIEEKFKMLSAEDRPKCRILVGMANTYRDGLKRFNSQMLGSGRMPEHYSNKEIHDLKKKAISEFRRQLMIGAPDNKQQTALKRLKQHLESEELKVRLYGKKPLHAKLYLIHRDDNVAPMVGILGSSNLTYGGLVSNEELNVDVVDSDATKKLKNWFEDKWEQEKAIDLEADLIQIIEKSWVEENYSPYEIYIKTAYHLSKQAIEGFPQFVVPKEFVDKMLEHQVTAVQLASHKLNTLGGVLIADVVGLGKTLIAVAVAKIFQIDRDYRIMVICPAHLVDMWEQYMEEYNINAKIVSLGKLQQLENARKYQIVIIDEAHNMRNSRTDRHKRISAYIKKNKSKVVLLTATPYNKQFLDVGNLLMLFKKHDDNLGITPANYINELKGEAGFNARHPQIVPTTLAAFEQSEHVDDWKDLIQPYLIRRTRKNILANAATDVKSGRKYIAFGEQKYFFPKRVSKIMSFELSENNESDCYAQLYSDKVVDMIGDLKLPRYGLQKYIDKKIRPDNTVDQGTINRLTKAGMRLRGFARTGLFKRLESSGYSFLVSIRKHLIKNMVLKLSLLDGKIAIPDSNQYVIEDFEDDDDSDILELEEESKSTADDEGISKLQSIANNIYKDIKNRDMSMIWLSSKYFTSELNYDIDDDNNYLRLILGQAGNWDPLADRKLAALIALCNNTHKKDKILVFSQYRDTIKYLYESSKKEITGVDIVHGELSASKTRKAIIEFSPQTNGFNGIGSSRVLLTTDKLSEGVNLQDSHIVVNYDLPWAIINLIQRAGRVDRIGQLSEKVYCYSALPEKGIEKIINLRKKINERIQNNHELISSEEHFFDDHKIHVLKGVHDGTIDLSDDEESESDLLTHAFDVWKQAIHMNPELENKIITMPDSVHSTKEAGVSGAIVYFKDCYGNNSLMQLDDDGTILSQSQYKILKLMECNIMQPQLERKSNLFTLVQKAFEEFQSSQSIEVANLGSKNSVRYQLYSRLTDYNSSLLSDNNIQEQIDVVIQNILENPLQEEALLKIGRQLKIGITDRELVNLTLGLKGSDELCQIRRKSGEMEENSIVCSLGLSSSNNE